MHMIIRRLSLPGIRIHKVVVGACTEKECRFGQKRKAPVYCMHVILLAYFTFEVGVFDSLQQLPTRNRAWVRLRASQMEVEAR